MVAIAFGRGVRAAEDEEEGRRRFLRFVPRRVTRNTNTNTNNNNNNNNNNDEPCDTGCFRCNYKYQTNGFPLDDTIAISLTDIECQNFTTKDEIVHTLVEAE